MCLKHVGNRRKTASSTSELTSVAGRDATGGRDERRMLVSGPRQRQRLCARGTARYQRKTEQKEREADGMTSREDPALPRFRDGDLSSRTMLLIGALGAPMAGLARDFSPLSTSITTGHDRTENKGALSVTHNAPTGVITTYVLLETSADSRDVRERGLPSPSCIRHLIPACGDSTPRTPRLKRCR